jgi:hypothetical protein
VEHVQKLTVVKMLMRNIARKKEPAANAEEGLTAEAVRVVKETGVVEPWSAETYSGKAAE